MSVYSIMFSPTGGTKKVMDIIGRELGAEKNIDLTRAYDFTDVQLMQEDICIIGVPSYGGRVPLIALERIRLINSNNARAILVVAYGNRAYDDTLLELYNEVSECDFRVVAAIAAVAEHSIVRAFGAGRPDEEDKSELMAFSQRIKKVLMRDNTATYMIDNTANTTAYDTADATTDNTTDDTADNTTYDTSTNKTNSLCNKIELSCKIPGNFPYRERGASSVIPRLNKKCTGCGICEAKCPTKAITLASPHTTDPDKCILCMRCVAICPEQAREVSESYLEMVSQKLRLLCKERKENELFI